ncbi:uncharacterized protein KY384_006665 [Bacidia gigantensis]|uniref:uncharacterized protein n=1 Tax=Bacidia gigantensis TaxID=2732470 RepID=UPI001D04EC81|nr:uncharacterized protein KY384_006665 [Bacidia gigantensis]KAG8528976.1 hypothetical protein KY384_006665 [Bacidia gigantensis]
MAEQTSLSSTSSSPNNPNNSIPLNDSSKPDSATPTPTPSHLTQAPIAYEMETYTRGLSPHYSRPAITFQSTEWEPQACARLSTDARGYVYGSAGQRETCEKNRAAFRKWSVVPRRIGRKGGEEGKGRGLIFTRVATDSFPDLRVKVLGEELESPIAVAPVGVQRIFHPEGEEAVARACASVGVPMCMSTAASASIEDVAVANGGERTGGGKGNGEGKERIEGGGRRWFQLYWPANKDNDITISLLTRAKKAGFTVLFVTLDTYTVGWRPSDLDNGYNPFIRADNIGVEPGFSDPVFRGKWRGKYGVEVEEMKGEAARAWTGTVFPGFSHGWEDVAFLREQWEGPIVLKGIMSVEDARKCVEVGVQGIVVSNHGGRQMDGG